ncbi:MAG: hypothetical protein IT436_09780 [Phycisphaerales bacterium]|nr:hypothetical protein [Phycisphaerales bacterium]
MTALKQSDRAIRGFVRLTGGLLLAGAVTLGTGCENAGQGAISGGAVGALGGLAIGSLSGNAGAGAAIGAISGAVAGGVIGDQNRRAEQSQQEMRYQEGSSR